MSFPIIDISKIDDPESQLIIAKEITDACSQWGFLLLKGHPIRSEDVNEMFQLSKEFFQLPEEQKEPWPINAKYLGYVGSFKDRKKDDKMSMWFGGVPGALDAGKDALPPFWHEHTAKLDRFKHNCHGLVIKMLVCFALAMDLPDRNYFADAHAEAAGNGNALRMLMYPAREKSPGDATRMQPHSDSGSVTLLFQDSAGLEVESPDGDWVKAPCVKDHILVNLGDALAFWSGGQLKATKHRVTFDGVPFHRERQSMAYFGSADPATVLQPIKNPHRKMEMYSANGMMIPQGITVGEYGRRIMESIYGPSAVKNGANEAAKTSAVAAS